MKPLFSKDDPDIKAICALHRDIVDCCRKSGLALGPSVLACLMSAVAINRAAGEMTHAELVAGLRSMETL